MLQEKYHNIEFISISRGWITACDYNENSQCNFSRINILNIMIFKINIFIYKYINLCCQYIEDTF